jgi:membrane protein DedA with SNARE-associated domain
MGDAMMRPVPLGFAVLVAAVLVLRWRHLPWSVRLGGILAAAAFVLYGLDVVRLPDAEKTLGDIGETLGGWTYLLVGAVAFLETGAFIGLVAPGEVTVIAGGVVAGQGVIELVPLTLLVWACCLAGDNLSFWLGRRLGRGWIERNGEKVMITEDRLSRVERFFERHGGLTILIGRYIGFVRPLAPFIAGFSNMSPKRFFSFDIVGTGLWAATFTVLGYVSWQNFDQAVSIASNLTLALGTLFVLGLAAVVVRSRHNVGRT